MTPSARDSRRSLEADPTVAMATKTGSWGLEKNYQANGGGFLQPGSRPGGGGRGRDGGEACGQRQPVLEAFGLWVIRDRLLPCDFLGPPALRSPFPPQEAMWPSRDGPRGAPPHVPYSLCLDALSCTRQSRNCLLALPDPSQGFLPGTVQTDRTVLASFSPPCLAPRSTGAPAGRDRSSLCACPAPPPGGGPLEGREHLSFSLPCCQARAWHVANSSK